MSDKRGKEVLEDRHTDILTNGEVLEAIQKLLNRQLNAKIDAMLKAAGVR